MKTLQREEAAYLDKWLACGAGKESFEALHALYLEEHVLGWLTGVSEMEMTGKRAAWDIKMTRLWDDIKLELHRDAGGAFRPGNGISALAGKPSASVAAVRAKLLPRHGNDA